MADENSVAEKTPGDPGANSAGERTSLAKFVQEVQVGRDDSTQRTTDTQGKEGTHED